MQFDELMVIFPSAILSIAFSLRHTNRIYFFFLRIMLLLYTKPGGFDCFVTKWIHNIIRGIIFKTIFLSRRERNGHLNIQSPYF